MPSKSFCIFISLITLVSGLQFRCPHDGVFENPLNKHSYVRCSDGRAHILQCGPGGDETTKWTKVFNGRECVDPYECPEIDGTYTKYEWGRVWYKCHGPLPQQHRCSEDHHYDGRNCVRKIRAESQRRPHFKLLLKDRNLVKFQFDNMIVTDTFNELTWSWHRTIDGAAKK